LIILLCVFFSNSLLKFQGGQIVGRLIFDLFWAYVITEQNFAKNSFFQLRVLKTFTFWGKYTYGLYMLHPIGILVIDIIERLANIPMNEQLVLFLKGLIGFFLSLLLAKLSYHLLELPFLRLKEKFTIIRNKPLQPIL
jgi:peptidoglycan/LPS O-acetylase OafA/YrhL